MRRQFSAAAGGVGRYPPSPDCVQAHPSATTDGHLQTLDPPGVDRVVIAVVRVAARPPLARHFDDNTGALAEPLNHRLRRHRR
jgi:hypothetical protein